MTGAWNTLRTSCAAVVFSLFFTFFSPKIYLWRSRAPSSLAELRVVLVNFKTPFFALVVIER